MVILKDIRYNKSLLWFDDWYIATQYIKLELIESEYDNYEFVRVVGKFYYIKKFWYKLILNKYTITET